MLFSATHYKRPRTTARWHDGPKPLLSPQNPRGCGDPWLHIVPVAYSMAHRGVVETHLSSLRVSRARTVALSYFTTAPHLLLQSDLIFSTSRHFASFFAGALTARRAPAADRVPADGLSHAL